MSNIENYNPIGKTCEFCNDSISMDEASVLMPKMDEESSDYDRLQYAHLRCWLENFWNDLMKFFKELYPL